MVVDYDEGKITFGQLQIDFEGAAPTFTPSTARTKMEATISIAGQNVFSGTVRLMETGNLTAPAKGKLTSSLKFQIVRPDPAPSPSPSPSGSGEGEGE